MSSGISVVIPSTGHLTNLSRLLPSLWTQELSGINLQVIVVMNGMSEVEFKSLQQQATQSWPGVEMVWANRKGVNIARNEGLARARNEIVYFLDDDCELQQKNIIKNYISSHSEHTNYFAIGGGYKLPLEHRLFDEIYNYIQMSWFFGGQIGGGKKLVDTHYLLGGNFCLKREFVVKHQLQFEPSIQYGGSELDFFKQATRMGLKLGAIDLEIIHNTRESFLSVGRKVFKQGRGKYFIDTKFGNDNVTSQSSGGKYLLLRQMYSYWFWAGYYGAGGKRWKVLAHMFRDLIGYIDVLRFNLLKKLNR